MREQTFEELVADRDYWKQRALLYEFLSASRGEFILNIVSPETIKRLRVRARTIRASRSD